MQPIHLTMADGLRQAAGWNQRITDWSRLLSWEPEGCFVARIHQETVGTVTTTRYGTELAWIGMMLVLPEYRGRGIGTSLMTAALRYLDGHSVRCVMLDATPAGRPMYERLGFREVLCLHRWQRTSSQRRHVTHSMESESPPEQRSRRADPDPDLNCLVPLDTAAFGVDRRNWLSLLAQDSRLTVAAGGYGMLRPGAFAEYLGPVVAESPDVAQRIVARLLDETTDSVYWDVPEPNPHAVNLACGHGFTRQRPLCRMSRGPCALAPDMSLQYGIADPGTG